MFSLFKKSLFREAPEPAAADHMREKPPQEPGVFVCPYCFRKVRHDQVCFLVPFSEEDVKKSYFDHIASFDYEEQEDEQLRAQREESEALERLKELFRKRAEDEQLDQFWAQIGGEAAYRSNPAFKENIQWNSPLVTPQNVDDMTDYGYETDTDDFVCAVHDRLTHQESRVRLCPHCHNVLPEQYGKYQTYFISIVGITSSGKTLYLTQLLGNIEEYLGNVGIQVLFRDDEAERFQTISTVDELLPNATKRDVLRPPITLTLQDGYLKQRYTLVLYDIAGENCVAAESLKKYGPYIERADGIIMMLDPVQFPYLETVIDASSPEAGEIGEKGIPVSKVLATMNKSFLISRMDSDMKVTMPFAFTLSKSDYLDPILAGEPRFSNSLIMENQIKLKPCGGRRLPDYAQIARINTDTLDVINKWGDPALSDILIKGFKRRSFFSVSALGGGTRWVLSHQGKLAGSYDSGMWSSKSTVNEAVIDLSEPDGLKTQKGLESLITELWRERDADRRICYLSYDLRTEELLCVDMLPEEQNGEMLYIEVNGTEKAMFEQYLDRDRGWQRGVKMDFFKTPAQVPQPRRVEEPLYWLLWQLGLLPIPTNG